MSKDDLFAMFELDKPAPAAKAGIGITSADASGTAKAGPPATENAVKVDEWEIDYLLFFRVLIMVLLELVVLA